MTYMLLQLAGVAGQGVRGSGGVLSERVGAVGAAQTALDRGLATRGRGALSIRSGLIAGSGRRIGIIGIRVRVLVGAGSGLRIRGLTLIGRLLGLWRRLIAAGITGRCALVLRHRHGCPKQQN